MAHALTTIDVDVIPQFTAAYLRIAGDECAFIEAHTSHALPKLLAALDAEKRRVEDVRWVVVTHAHLDHAAGAGALLARCPNAVLLAHPSAAKNLIDPTKLIEGAKLVYGEERFARLYGDVQPIPAERVRKLADKETFDLGGATLRVRHTAGHAWHHFVVEDPALDTVYTGLRKPPPATRPSGTSQNRSRTSSGAPSTPTRRAAASPSTTRTGACSLSTST